MTQDFFVKLLGGLGNQLFQFSAGFAYCLRHNKTLKFDTDGSVNGCRPEILKLLGADKYCVQKLDRTYFDLVKHRCRFIPSAFGSWVLVERGQRFERALVGDENIRGIWGYWQNERYFSDYREDIVSKINSSLGTVAVAPSDVAAIHVRGGDYLSSKAHKTLPERYYIEACRILRARGVKKFVMFTDDPLHADPIMKKISEFGALDVNKSLSAIDVLRDMSGYGNYILANSTLSWWASYLSPSVNKLVIAPLDWSAGAQSMLPGASHVSLRI
jgi:hypothetical protein